jgi:hypothetical protein
MRRFVLVFLLAVLLAPSGVSAASRKAPKGWRVYTSRPMHISLEYPSNWKLFPMVLPNQPGEVTLSHQGTSIYSLQIQILPFSAAASIGKTLQLFLGYARRTTHSSVYARTRWSAVTLGGRTAMAGVLRPSTEGGSSLSDAIYIAQWRGLVYEITAADFHKPPLSRLSQFPSIYAKILATWRFL